MVAIRLDGRLCDSDLVGRRHAGATWWLLAVGDGDRDVCFFSGVCLDRTRVLSNVRRRGIYTPSRLFARIRGLDVYLLAEIVGECSFPGAPGHFRL